MDQGSKARLLPNPPLTPPSPLPTGIQALKTLGANKDAELPIKLFEVGLALHLARKLRFWGLA